MAGHRIGEERGLEAFSKTTHTHNPSAGPVSIDPDDAQTTGVGPGYAFQDHQHAIVAATANTIQPDATAAEGAAASFARSDHTHGIVAAVAVTLTGVNAEGASTSFARADHNHAVPGWLTDTVATGQGTSSTTYADLATVGPAVTPVVPASGLLLVFFKALMVNSAASAFLMSVALSGDNTVAASDAWALGSSGSTSFRISMMHMFTGLTPGTGTTVTCKYRTNSGATTSTFTDRELVAIPVLT